MSHQISNRVATLSGLSEIIGGDPTVPPILRALIDEVPRLEEGIRLLRLLATPATESAEPLEPVRTLRDAAALAALHPDAKDILVVIEDSAEIPPVVARPIALTHAFTVAMVSAAKVQEPELALDVTLRAAGEVLVVTIGGWSIELPVLSARG